MSDRLNTLKLELKNIFRVPSRQNFLFHILVQLPTMLILLFLPLGTLAFTQTCIPYSSSYYHGVSFKQSTRSQVFDKAQKNNNNVGLTPLSSSTTTSNESNLNLSEFNNNEPLPNAIPDEETLSKSSKLEKEFYSMMKDFSVYTPKDIASIHDPSYRALFEGVSSGSNEPLVMNAFSIIFNDLMPIRIAGRMIYNHLKTVMDANVEARKQEEDRIQDETGLSIDAIYDGRRTFMAALGNGKDGEEGLLTMTELVDSGIVEMVVEMMEYESFDAFVERIEHDENEKLNFERFMVGLQKCAVLKNSNSDDTDPMMCDISCDLEDVLSVIAQRIAPIEAEKKAMSISDRKQKYSKRFDGMVKSFEEWETAVPSGDGRMIQVLNGCFAGAKNEEIVNALKIVYMDYSALRVGGNLVFKLMGKLVNTRKKKE